MCFFLKSTAVCIISKSDISFFSQSALIICSFQGGNCNLYVIFKGKPSFLKRTNLITSKWGERGGRELGTNIHQTLKVIRDLKT